MHIVDLSFQKAMNTLYMLYFLARVKYFITRDMLIYTHHVSSSNYKFTQLLDAAQYMHHIYTLREEEVKQPLVRLAFEVLQLPPSHKRKLPTMLEMITVQITSTTVAMVSRHSVAAKALSSSSLAADTKIH